MEVSLITYVVTFVRDVLADLANLITVVGVVCWAYKKIKDACGNRRL